MNADEARERAGSALAGRLRAWGVDTAEIRGREYVAELMNAGWRWMPPENRPTPPRREQECRVHAGQWDGRCAGCAADRIALPDPSAESRHEADKRRAAAHPKPPIRTLIPTEPEEGDL